MKNPLIPMSAVTGRPTKDFIKWFMGEFRRVGITQFLVYPRAGCEVPYLSEEWFTTVGWILKTAEKLDFEAVWLYDEFNWPSGQCGGRVMAEKPEYSSHFLTAEKLADGAVRFEFGLDSKYPNLLNPDAVDFFIQTTHEEYYRRFGDQFGKLIKGIFTDEPSFAYPTTLLAPNASQKIQIAWYPEMEDNYKRLTGRELKNDMKRQLEGTANLDFIKSYHEVVAKRFRETFFDKIRNWCDAHNILLTGHLMAEHNIHALRFNGDPLQQIAGFSMPGMDEINTSTTLDKIEWQTLGTARYGIEKRGNGGLAELFALGPADMPAMKYHQMIWLVAMFGIDHYLMAVAQFQAQGNIYKKGWYNPTTPAQTWFDHYAELGEDAAKAASFAGRKVLPEIEIRYAEYEPDQNEMLKKLVAAQRPWKFIHRNDKASADAPAVLRIEQDGIVEEKSGKHFKNIDAFIDWTEGNIPRIATVTDVEGKRVRDVLTRCYADGNAVILDLRDRKNEPRVLALDFNGFKTIFALWAGGCVIIGPDGFTPGAIVSAFPKSIGISCEKWQLTLDRPNILCPEFDDMRTLLLTVKEDVGDVVFMLRRYGEEASATLDSEEIVVSKVPKALPQGLNELYLQTMSMRLTEGEHVIQLQGDAEEYPYLPGVFLAGNFAVEATDSANGKMTIRALPEYVPNGDLTVKGLRNYAGKLILEKNVCVPEKATFIRLDTNDLCVDVQLDDTFLGIKALPSFISSKKLGAKAWAPFIWPVPKEKCGKNMKLSVILDAPVSAIFGRERFSKMNAGLYTPPTTDGAIGIFAAEWLLEEPTH
ncbi:MAG: hypothetical protein J6X49_05660 [Victivallales bacterium]|nr:hypothetical protein [Victivallales bacterium]